MSLTSTAENQPAIIQFSTALALVSIYAVTFISNSIFLLLNLQLTSFPIVVSIAVATILIKMAIPRNNKQFAVALVLFTGVLLFSFAISYFTFDKSHDGQDYQQAAIIELTNGWNPIYKPKKDITYNDFWLNHYPKAPWIAAATVYKLTGNIEAGKVFNWLLLFGVFFLTQASYARFANNKYRGAGICIAALVALNPVVISQLSTFYIDNQVYSIITLFVLFFIGYALAPSHANLLGIFFCLTVGLNIKFTGTIYILLFTVILLVSRMSISEIRKGTLSFMVFLTATFFFSVIILGFNPYITNTVHNRNPFYPIYGSGIYNKEYVISNQVPTEFLQKHSLKKLIYSNVLSSQNNYKQINYKIKTPFTFTKSELETFISADTRIGGFGPLFGGALILTLIAFAILFIIDPQKAKYLLLTYISLLTTVFVNEESWWARYSPQIWLVPIIVVIALLQTRKKLPYIYGIIISLLLLVNCLLVIGPNFYSNYNSSRATAQKLSEIARRNEPILVYDGVFSSSSAKLKRYNISYSKVSKLNALECPDAISIGISYSYIDCP